MKKGEFDNKLSCVTIGKVVLIKLDGKFTKSRLALEVSGEYKGRQGYHLEIGEIGSQRILRICFNRIADIIVRE